MPRSDTQFKPGSSGRRKGSKNKVTRSMVEDVLHAYNNLGGVEYLTNLGKNDPALFVAMLKRLVPNKTEAKVEMAAAVQRPDLAAPGQVGAEAARKAAEDAKRSVGVLAGCEYSGRRPRSR